MIEELFYQPLAVVRDPLHSKAEDRFKAIGRSNDGRVILVVFTLRPTEHRTRIRPISARHTHRKEIAYYEKAIAQAEQRS